MSRSFALTEDLDAFIDREVESGRYGRADDVVHDALDLLRDWGSSMDAESLRRMVQTSREDETLVDAEAVFDRLERKYERAAGA